MIGLRNEHILLVDDDEDHLSSYKSFLLNEGFKVDTANNGKFALDKVRSQKFDLIMLDVLLPGMMGYEVAKEIRKYDKNIRIIFITGFPSFRTCIESLDLGIEEILLKPITANELVRVVVDTLKIAS